MKGVFAIIVAGLISLALLGADKPIPWWQPLRQIKAWHLNQKGQQAYRANEPDKALKAFREAREVAGEHPILRFNEGTTLMALGKLKEAEQALRSALKGIPPQQVREQASAHYNLGNLYFAQKRWNEAAKAYIAALKRTPNDWDAKFNLELVLRQQQKKPPQSQQKRQPPPPPPPPPVNEKKPLMKQLQGRLNAPWHGERDW
ncbi:MAG: tetratricopeptide repeat protein [Armatimonadota bacterium]|nr:tetratricopeptide repeat protein [Armatimonadota bacterium]MDW8141870.1 tetratricopeptide repeat protein [Armatimonadota bacterium]